MQFVITKIVTNYSEEYKNQFTNRHREDGPAIVYTDGGFKGTYGWYFDGKLHRVGGHAYYFSPNDGDRVYGIKFKWARHHLQHRLNAPALIYKNGNKSYWEFGRNIK
jgi:hypothetical protein